MTAPDNIIKTVLTHDYTPMVPYRLNRRGHGRNWFVHTYDSPEFYRNRHKQLREIKKTDTFMFADNQVVSVEHSDELYKHIGTLFYNIVDTNGQPLGYMQVGKRRIEVDGYRFTKVRVKP